MPDAHITFNLKFIALWSCTLEVWIILLQKSVLTKQHEVLLSAINQSNDWLIKQSTVKNKSSNRFIDHNLTRASSIFPLTFTLGSIPLTKFFVLCNFVQNQHLPHDTVSTNAAKTQLRCEAYRRLTNETRLWLTIKSAAIKLCTVMPKKNVIKHKIQCSSKRNNFISSNSSSFDFYKTRQFSTVTTNKTDTKINFW